MPQGVPSFRDFGILPDQLGPPPEQIRCFFSKGRIVGQYIGTGLVLAFGLGFAVLFALTLPLPLNVLACVATLAATVAVVFLATHHDYRWVELEGNTLRAKHFYTGHILERSVDEIASLATMYYAVRSTESFLVEKLLGRVKGIEIQFRDRRTPLRILRADPAMTHAKEMIEAILYRMGQIHELDAEIVNLDGKPLVRNIYWKGEQPVRPPGKGLKVVLVVFMFMAGVFGPILGYIGASEKRLHELGSVPPQELPLSALIQKGPGSNRHVTITNFRPGGYSAETNNNSTSWTRVWVALFPVGAEAREKPTEIKVVFETNGVRDEAALKQLLQKGRLTGICSDTPRSSWGLTLGPQLVQANQGLPLQSAWDIDELREVPSAASVTWNLAGSAGCFVVTIVLALLLFWKG
jgi:hypothetical protein